MPPKGFKKPPTITADDYTRAIGVVSGMEQIASSTLPLFKDVPDISHVYLILTVLRGAVAELTAKRDALIQAQEGGNS